MIIYNYEGVMIHELANVNLHTEGEITGSGMKDNRLVTWKANVTPRGWSIRIIELHGRTTMYEGPTFNLILEIATAINRI